MFVDKWRFQVPDRNVSLSNEWRHLVEGVIICVVAMLDVIFYRASKGNITHKQQSDSFYEREVKDSLCRHNVIQRCVLGRNENELDGCKAFLIPHHVNKADMPQGTDCESGARKEPLKGDHPYAPSKTSNIFSLCHVGRTCMFYCLAVSLNIAFK